MAVHFPSSPLAWQSLAHPGSRPEPSLIPGSLVGAGVAGYAEPQASVRTFVPDGGEVGALVPGR